MASEQQQRVTQLLDDAFKAFEAGDDERARRLCREALAIDPNSSTGHSLMGLLYEREGLATEAAREFESVLAANPESVAESATLERLRSQRETAPMPVYDEDDEPVGAMAKAAPYLVAAATALAVALVIFFGGRFLLNRGDNDTAVASAAQLNEYLELAQEAFNQGRYDVAMDNARRVLQIDPENAVAREIYDRSAAFLRGATEQPVSPQPVVPAPQVQTVQSQPAVTDTTAPRAPAAPPPPTAVEQRANQVERTTQAVSSLLRQAPGTPMLPPVQPANPQTATRPRSGVVRPPVTAYDSQSYIRPSVRRGVVQRPPADDVEPIERPDEGDPYRAAPPANENRGSIRVEVHRREPLPSGTRVPEVRPDLEDEAPAPAPEAERTASPEVAERQAEQERLERQRRRQSTADLRRIEREQGR